MVFSLTSAQGCAMTDATPDGAVDADGDHVNANTKNILDFEAVITSEYTYGDQGGFAVGDSACTGTQIASFDFHGADVEIYKN